MNSFHRPCLLTIACLLLICDGRIPVFAEETTAATESVTLVPGTWQDVQKLVAQNSGRVIVVDVWSTACLPCMKEFPNLVALQKTHGDRIVCVSLNVDYAGIKSKPPEYYRARVEKFLNQQQARIRNILATTDVDAVFEQLKLNSIPAVYVFGPDGKLAKRFDDSMLTPDKEDAFTYEEDINPLIAKLLSK